MKDDRLLDSQALIWLISDDKRLDENIREDIECFRHQYHVSDATILEYIQLQQLGKVKPLPYATLEMKLHDLNITPESMLCKNARQLQDMPFLRIDGKQHTDPFDRIIIATAIANKYTLISSDIKFPHYRKLGLSLIELCGRV